MVVDHNPDLLARLTEALPDVRVVPNHITPGCPERGTPASNWLPPMWWFFSMMTPRPDPVGWPPSSGGMADPGTLGVGGRIDPQGHSAARVVAAGVRLGRGLQLRRPEAGVVRNLIGANASFRRELFADGGFMTDIGRTASRGAAARV